MRLAGCLPRKRQSGTPMLRAPMVSSSLGPKELPLHCTRPELAEVIASAYGRTKLRIACRRFSAPWRRVRLTFLWILAHPGVEAAEDAITAAHLPPDLALESFASAVARKSIPLPEVHPEDLAYILYTSGS